MLGWLLLNRKEITNVVKDTKKREHFYTVGGNTNYYGKHYEVSSKN